VYLSHADDEILCEWLLRTVAKSGRFLRLVILTQGEQGWKNLPIHMDRRNIIEIRMNEFQRSCRLLGVQNFDVWKVPDSEVRLFHEQTLINMIKADTMQWLPDRVVTFARDGVTKHDDHEKTHLRVVEAIRQLGLLSTVKIFGITMPKELIDPAMQILMARRRTQGAYAENLMEFAPPLSSVIKVPIDLEQKRRLVDIYASQGLGRSYIQLFQLPGMGEFYLPINP
jgi:LmbE family N-acetylglucosaminyl deacetylase